MRGCGLRDPGSIPGGDTKDRNTCPAAGFLLLCQAELCFALAKQRAGVASEFSDEKIRPVTTRCVELSSIALVVKWI